jgi:hypothetical protein
MKTCKRCLREYEESISVHKSPAHELGELFLKAADPEGENNFCPDCQEETGIFILLGFGQ